MEFIVSVVVHSPVVLFPRLFPSLEYILYIDVDTVVRHDLTALWKRVISSDKLLVVAERYVQCAV